MRLKIITPMIGLAATAALLSAQSTTAQGTFANCDSLNGRQIPASAIGLPTNGARITAARIVPAVAPGATPAPGAPPGPPPQPGPEYCRVQGSILPVDPNAPTIDFAVGLPANWNGGSWQLGGGGANGSIPGLTGAGPGGIPGAPSLLDQGYATYGGDSGHQGNATEWVTNRESWMNFSYEQLKKTSDAAQEVIAAMYGRRAETRYFAGSSQGGREGLEVVARYPEDYDGVFVAVPLAYFQGLLIDPTVKMQVQAQPGGFVPAEKRPAITAAVVAVCDNLDGLMDNVISNPVACSAKLDVPLASTPLRSMLCAPGTDNNSCLTEAQLRSVNALHTPVRYPYTLPNGKTDWPGWGAGSEVALLSRTQPDPATQAGEFGLGAGLQRQAFGASTSFNLFDLDFTTHRQRLEGLSRELDVPADWSAFFRKGGKLIWMTAASDTVSNPRAQMRLYEDVVAANGREAVDGSVRYYVIPMADHGGSARSSDGKAMPSRWNPLGMLRDWVERGVTPPDAPILANYDGANITSTRPICRYPAYPKYIGGDATWSAAFVCETNR